MMRVARRPRIAWVRLGWWLFIAVLAVCAAEIGAHYWTAT